MSTKLASGCYLGKVLQRQQWDHLWLTQTQHTQCDWLPTHAHQNAYFCFVRTGQFSERFGSQVRQCTPSMLIFHPPEERHSERIESPRSASFNIELDQCWLQPHAALARLSMEPLELSDEHSRGIARQLYREFREPDQVSPLCVQGLTLQLLAGLARSQHSPAMPSWVKRVRQLLHDRQLETLNTATLAEAAGVHPVYLVQAFRKHVGVTPGEYQRQLRLQWACEQLKNTTMPIAIIALRAGYADQSHFARHLQRHTGCTPRAYRQLHAS
jgi:AraC family transcriptional regulator